MKLPIPSFKTAEVHPVDTAKTAARTVGKGLQVAGNTVTHASVASVTKGAADLAVGGVHGAGKLLTFVGKKLAGE